ncbi:MAG: DUF1501 domain-containing protein [Verrucomicrobia bacterium]|nr:DUF1501 domain-containing protein [Verrucomicrobiota bacterium]
MKNITLNFPATRREFLSTSAKGAGLLAFSQFVPGFLSDSIAADAPRPETDRRILVLVQLAGGNDGLNTLIPYEDSDYYRLRPTLGIKKSEALKLTDELGFHSSCLQMSELFKEGKLSIVQNVGYPNPNRSHFRSTEIWEGATDSNEFGDSGWIGRYLDNNCSGTPSLGDPEAITFGSELPLTVQGESTHNLFSINNRPGRVQRADYGLLDYMVGTSDTKDNKGFLKQTMMDTLITEERIQKLFTQFSSTVMYPSNRLGASLKNIASLISAGLPTRVYYATLGGFDTHQGQAATHQRLLRDLSTSLSAFQKDLENKGLEDQVLTMTFSEFGRRPSENESGGTDHGTAAPLFVLGSQIKDTLVGKAPNLKLENNKDLTFSTDFRSIYATVLDKWLECDSEAVLGRKFNQLSFI